METIQPEEQYNKEMKGRSYLNTAEAVLDDYAGNKIGQILMGIELNKRRGKIVVPMEKFENSLKEFVGGMEEMLQRIKNGSLEETTTVNRKVIKNFINDARAINDVSDESAVRALYEKYRKVRGLENKH